MSFILDALRKAERDRHLGQPPSLVELTRAPATLKPVVGHQRAWILLALVVVMAVLLAAVIREPDRETQLVTVAAAPQVRSVPAPAQPPAALPPAQPVAVENLQEEFLPQLPLTTALDADTELTSLDDLIGEGVPAVAVAVDDDGDEPASSSAAWADGEALSATPAPIPLDGGADEGDALPPPEESGEELPALAAVEPAQPAAASESGPRLLRDMPVEFRSSFPAVQIDVHVYDDDPQRRWILVQGRRHKEGDSLPQGSRVEAITAQGTVVGWLDQSILIPLSP